MLCTGKIKLKRTSNAAGGVGHCKSKGQADLYDDRGGLKWGGDIRR